MATPNIEELIDRLYDWYTTSAEQNRLDMQKAADILQSQAERIKVIERESEMRRIELHDVMLESDQLRAQLADAELHTKQVERGLDKATAQLAAIRAQEPALVVEKEPDYWSVGHFHEGSKPHIKPTKVWCLPIGTKLFTRPMPAQDVTELVEALKACLQCFDEMKGRKPSFVEDSIAMSKEALSKYKGAK